MYLALHMESGLMWKIVTIFILDFEEFLPQDDGNILGQAYRKYSQLS